MFRCKPLNFSKIASIAFEHVKDYYTNRFDPMGLNYFILNKPSMGSWCLYFVACWNIEIGKEGAGFCLVDSNTKISYVGASMVNITSKIEAGIRALELALNWTRSEGLNVRKVLISSSELCRRIEGDGLPNVAYA